MAKAYWIARVDVRDLERYKDYVAAGKLAFDKYGANFLARDDCVAKPHANDRANGNSRGSSDPRGV